MIKRTTTTTTYEYDKDGNMIKKTIVEEVFEENNNTLTYPNTTPYTPSPFYYCNDPTSTSTKASDVLTTKTNVTTEC